MNQMRRFGMQLCLLPLTLALGAHSMEGQERLKSVWPRAPVGCVEEAHSEIANLSYGGPDRVPVRVGLTGLGSVAAPDCGGTVPPQPRAAGFTRLCDEHRLLAVVGGGIVLGGAAVLVIKGLESTFGSSDESYLRPVVLSALIGAGVMGFSCAVATGRLWYRAL